VENKGDSAINLMSYLRTESINCLIELQYAVTVTPSSTVHAFMIGNEMDDQYYSFGTDGGFIAIGYSQEEAETSLMNWTGCGKLNQSNAAMNKFSVLFLDGRCYYYVNNSLVYEGKNIPFIPATIFFQVSGKQKMELDYVRVYSLK
jgi:hypothetical protein